MTQQDCLHANFSADVKVARITDGDSGSVTNYVTELSVKCSECGMPFHFVGVDAGFGYLKPTCDFLGTTLYAPIASGESLPASGRLTYDMRGSGAGGRQ
jgi:hypothetical protein